MAPFRSPTRAGNRVPICRGSSRYFHDDGGSPIWAPTSSGRGSEARRLSPRISGRRRMSGPLPRGHRGSDDSRSDLKAPVARDASSTMVEARRMSSSRVCPCPRQIGLEYKTLARAIRRLWLDSALRPDGRTRIATATIPRLHRVAGVLAMTGTRNGAPELPGVQIRGPRRGCAWGANRDLGGS